MPDAIALQSMPLGMSRPVYHSRQPGISSSRRSMKYFHGLIDKAFDTVPINRRVTGLMDV
jgi:hypothetical protein